METFTIVAKKQSILYQFLGALVLAVALVCLVAACWWPWAIVGAVILGCVWFFFFFRHSKEFEYSYFDGDLRLSRVMNKSRRKTLYHLSMDDVIAIAPPGNDRVAEYERQKQITKKDLSSGYRSHPHYELVARQEGKGPILIAFEPDEDLLHEIEIRYRSKIVRLPQAAAEEG